MALAKLPTREVYARFLASGMTRYSLEEIGDALGAHDVVYANFCVVMGDVADLLRSHIIDQNGFRTYYDFDEDADRYEHQRLAPDVKAAFAKLAKFYFQQCGENYILMTKKNTKEEWPVATWRKESERCERATNRLRALLAKCGYYAEKTAVAL